MGRKGSLARSRSGVALASLVRRACGLGRGGRGEAKERRSGRKDVGEEGGRGGKWRGGKRSGGRGSRKPGLGGGVSVRAGLAMLIQDRSKIFICYFYFVFLHSVILLNAIHNMKKTHHCIITA